MREKLKPTPPFPSAPLTQHDWAYFVRRALTPFSSGNLNQSHPTRAGRANLPPAAGQKGLSGQPVPPFSKT
jgi:hypothetical protein